MPAVSSARPVGFISSVTNGLTCVVRGRDLVERDRNFLPALAAVGDVNVSFGVHGGIGHRMQVVGDLHAELDREGVAVAARGGDAHERRRRTFRHAAIS